MSFQTTDSKKEEFRKYLEKAGVIDQLTRVLVGLYEEPEKPSNAIEYVKKYLGSPVDIDVDKLKLEYEKLKDENIKLKRQIDELKKEVFRLCQKKQKARCIIRRCMKYQNKYMNNNDCLIHSEKLTNICIDCLQPLCPDCIDIHLKECQTPKIESIKTCRASCMKKLRLGITELQKILNEPEMTGVVNNKKLYDTDKIDIFKQKLTQYIDRYIDDLKIQLQNSLNKLYKNSAVSDIYQRLQGLVVQMEELCNKLEQEYTQIQTIKTVCVLNIDVLIQRAQNESKKEISKLEFPIIEFQENNLQQYQDVLKSIIYIENKKYDSIVSVQETSKISMIEQKLEKTQYQEHQGKKILHFFRYNSTELYVSDIDNIQNRLKDKFQKINLNIQFKIPVFHQSLISSQGIIYLVGGTIPDLNYPNTKSSVIYQYNWEKQTLVNIGKLMSPRSSHGLVILGDYLYSFSGLTQDGQIEKSCERFNLLTKSSQYIPNCLYPSLGSCCIVFQGCYVYKFGGVCESQIVQQIERFSIKQMIWMKVDPQISKQDSLAFKGFTQYSSGIQISDDSIIVFGGYYDKEQSSNMSFILKHEDDFNQKLIQIDQHQLPQAEGFWNQQSLIFDNCIYALQNKDLNGTVLQDQRRIIRFKDQWQNI